MHRSPPATRPAGLILSLALGCTAEPVPTPPEPAAACAATPATRRLNRDELRHTIEAVLGVDAPSFDGLPADGQVGGFTTVAAGATTSPALVAALDAGIGELLDGIFTAARPTLAVAHWSLADSAEGEGVAFLYEGTREDPWWLMWTDVPSELVFEIDEPGLYTVELPVEWAHGVDLGPEDGAVVPMVDLFVDDQPVGESTPIATSYPAHPVLGEELELAAGTHVLRLQYVNPQAHAVELGVDGVLQADLHAHIVGVGDLSVTGPLSDDDEPLIGPLARWVPCDPSSRACREQALAALASTAWRMDDPPVEAVTALVQGRLALGDSPLEALQTGFHGVFLSPRFVFRLPVETSARARASDLGLALWGTAVGPPDDAVALDLLADPRATWLVEDFGSRWLQRRGDALEPLVRVDVQIVPDGDQLWQRERHQPRHVEEQPVSDDLREGRGPG